MLLSSIHDDDCEFLATFGKGERGGVFYIPLSSLKIVDSVYTRQHCVALVLGATQQQKNQFSREKIRALDTIQSPVRPFPYEGKFRTKSKFLPQIHLFLDLQDSRFRRNIEIELQIKVLLARSARSPCQQKGISKFPKNEIEVSQITKNIRI